MRIITLFGALLVAFVRIALTLILAIGFLVFFVPNIIVRHSLKLY